MIFLCQNGNVDPVEANEWYHEDITKQEAATKLAEGKKKKQLQFLSLYIINI